MLKYVSKFTIDILPSVVATIIGAYIVNHYIAPRNDAPAAAVASTADGKKADPKPSVTSADIANIPESGVKAKGISEKALLEKAASEGPAVADRPVETASPPAEQRRVQPTPHEKPAKAAQTQPSAAPLAPVESAAAAEDRRDANELARAAIDRLRATEPHPAQEAARVPEPPRLPEIPRAVSTAAVQPLPPPVTVSAPAPEAVNPPTGSLPTERLTPPADIPVFSRPLDLRAEAGEVAPRQRTSVAEDVLSAAKSVFHAVLPR